MGLYVVECPLCGEAHQCFSGNVDQRCEQCQIEAAAIRSAENHGTPEKFFVPTEDGDMIVLTPQQLEDMIRSQLATDIAEATMDEEDED